MGKERTRFDEDFEGAARRARAKTRHERRMQRGAEAGVEPRPFTHVALEATVRLRAPLFATEERARVEAAMRALFPDAEFDPAAGPATVAAKARDLSRLAEVLRHARIRDAARSRLTESVESPSLLRFFLNKQAACAARANFVGQGEVLGAIEVEAVCGDALALAEELTWIEGESDERLFGTKLHTLPPERWRGAAGPGRPRGR